MKVSIPDSDKQLLNEYVSYHFEDDILIAIFLPGKLIDRDIAHKIVEDRLTLFNGKKYSLIVDGKEMKSIVFTREARDYFAKEGTQGLKAVAILVGSFLSKIISNLFITFSHPEIPIKLFTSREDAMQWLKQQEDKYE